MPTFFSINEFFGIQQQKDGTLLPEGSARDARNCCTWDGDLRVAKGYARHIGIPVAGNGKILKLIPLHGTSDVFYVVASDGVYVFKASAWAKIYSFASELADGQIDYTQVMIQNVPSLVIATGQTRMLKITLADDTVELFGAGLYSFQGAVFFYSAETKTITLSSVLSAEAIRHITLDGITVGGKRYKPKQLRSYSGDTVVLADTPTAAPVVDDAITVRGGGSEAKCNFVGMYYGRLLSAGDPDAPCRLYWSAVAGDGRSIEDWLSVDASADASGGYVEVGNESNNPIIGLRVMASYALIFKQCSVWRLYGDRPSNYTLECVERNAESMSNASVVEKYGTPYWLTMSGLTAFGEPGVSDAFNGIRYLREFTPLLSSVRMSKGAHADNRMYFSCKVSANSAYDDTIIEFDLSTGSIMIRNGFNVADMSEKNGRIYIVDGNRYVCEFNKGTDYDGVPIAAYWNTQPTTLGYKYYTKQITDLFMRCAAGSMKLTLYLDDAVRTIPRNTFGENDGYISIPVRGDRARSFSLRIENVAGSQFWIKGGIDIALDKEMKK